VDRQSGLAVENLPATGEKPDSRRWRGLWAWTATGIAGQALLAVIAVLLARAADAPSAARLARLDAVLAIMGCGLAVGIVATGCSAFRSGARQDTMALVGSFFGVGLLSLAYILLEGASASGLNFSHGAFHSSTSLLAAAGLFVALRMAAPVPLAGVARHLAFLGAGAAAAAVIVGLAIAASAATGGQPGLLAVAAFSTLVVILYAFAGARAWTHLRKQAALDSACLLVAAVAGIVAEILLLLGVLRPGLHPVAQAWNVGMFALLYAAVFYQSARRTYPQPRAAQAPGLGSEARFRSLLELSSDW
jgi:hypothetical protein